jgi:hypothetical protein
MSQTIKKIHSNRNQYQSDMVVFISDVPPSGFDNRHRSNDQQLDTTGFSARLDARFDDRQFYTT